MSKFPGGIFSKARGKTSGIVFSAARTRQGKLMTSRELVIPSNPQTAAQQANRNIFNFVQRMVRQAGPGIYRQDFNRAVEDLPGFHSLISLVRRAFFQSFPGEWNANLAVPDILQGELHFPDSVNVNLSTSSLTYSTENGSNGSPDDDVFALLWNGNYDDSDPVEDTGNMTVNTGKRDDGSIALDTSAPGMVTRGMLFLYMKNTQNPIESAQSIVRVYQQVF